MPDAGSSASAWPASLDALVAAPEYHKLLLENESVRVLEVTIPPGHTVPVHTHCWPGVQHILSHGEFVRRDAAGRIELDTRKLTTAMRGVVWSEPLPPHSVENVGETEIRVIVVEVKG